MRQLALWRTTHGDEMETDVVCYAVHAHAHAQHRHTAHIALIPALNHKQICYTRYTQTDTRVRLPTISPPIRDQTAVWGVPAKAFDLFQWMSFGHTFLPSPSISKQPFVPITDYPSYLEAISFCWLEHSQNSIFSSMLECLHFCCLLKCWLWRLTFSHNTFRL